MKQVSSNCIMRALPNGTIAHVNGSQLAAIVDEILAEVDSLPYATAALRLLSLGRLCLQSGYNHTALEAFRRAMKEIWQNDTRMTRRRIFFDAARGYDDAMRRVDPTWHDSTYRRAVYEFLARRDDRLYCLYGFDIDFFGEYSLSYRYRRLHNVDLYAPRPF